MRTARGRIAAQGIAPAAAGMQRAIDGERAILDAVATANRAQGEAIKAVLIATHDALRLFSAPERH